MAKVSRANRMVVKEKESMAALPLHLQGERITKNLGASLAQLSKVVADGPKTQKALEAAKEQVDGEGQ